MSGRKGMKQYSEEFKEIIRDEIAQGSSQIEVSKKYGVSRYSIQSWCGLRSETKIRQVAPLPKPKTFDEARELIDNYIYFYNHQRIQLKTGVAPLTLRYSA